MKVALTIAGSDSGGGAGLQADLKTFEAWGVFGTTVVTALTAQNTQGVLGWTATEPAMVALQLQAVLADLPVAAAKTGMLANAAIIHNLLQELPTLLPLVVDPVMVSTSGHRLLDEEAIGAMQLLLPRAILITPNLPEAEVLLGRAVIDIVTDAQLLAGRYSTAVLLKGGHSASGPEVTDVLVTADGTTVLRHPRLPLPREAHGTGCTLSAAIAAGLALGLPLAQAVVQARSYLQQALAQAPTQLGSGSLPLKHSVSWQR